MAIGADRVQVLIYEEASKGGDPSDDTMGIPTEINPREDAIESAGIYLQDGPSNRDETVYIERDGGSLRLRDQDVTSPVSLTILATKNVKVSSADTTPAFLESKLVPGDSITITKENVGANEVLRIAAQVSEVFSVDYDSAVNSLSTTSTTAQSAGISVTVPVDGDYVVFFDTEVRVSNNNGIMVISLSQPNNTTERTTSIRQNGGNKWQTSVTIEPYTGLSAGDVITALYRKQSGGGSANIQRRSMLLQRIG